MIPQEIIDKILDKVSLVEVISKYTDIKRSGRNFMALCPFHGEKTPSFSISEDKGLYHCFGCGASGNAIRFLMDYQKKSFTESVQELAGIAGIELEQTPDYKGSGSIKEKGVLLDICRETLTFFHNNLLNSTEAQKAREYIKKRKLSLESVKLYRLGYGGNGWNSLQMHLKEKGFSDSDLLKAGVVTRSSKPGSTGKYFDRFRERVIFPIFDRDGNCVGFGGRILTEDKNAAKYLNSPESPLFHKGSLLFSLNFAKDNITRQKTAILVEGYMDVIGLAQNGIVNAVAPLGTALTENQLGIIKKYCDTVIFLFDGDEAGISAANRAVDISVDSGLNQGVVILPQKKDPYDYVMEYGKDAFLQYITDRKLSPFEFKMRFFSKKIDIKTDKVRFLLAVFPYLSRVNSSIIREEYIKKLANFLEEDYGIVLSEYKSFLGKDKSLGRMIKESVKLVKSVGRVELEFIGL